MRALSVQGQVLTILIRWEMDITNSQVSSKKNLSCHLVDRSPEFSTAVSIKRHLENPLMKEVLLHQRESNWKISRWLRILKWSNKRYSNEKIWIDTFSITGTTCRTQLILPSIKGLDHLTKGTRCVENQSLSITVRSPIKTICLTVSQDPLNAQALHIQTPHRGST